MLVGVQLKHSSAARLRPEIWRLISRRGQVQRQRKRAASDDGPQVRLARRPTIGRRQSIGAGAQQRRPLFLNLVRGSARGPD